MPSDFPASRSTAWMSLISGAIAGALIMALVTRKRESARQNATYKSPKHWWPC